ncbi:MAG: hypothetical protein OXU63_16545 [Acidobacteriota bacterium]|nr:hypothetical protein [Acidobacteriota bacterium]
MLTSHFALMVIYALQVSLFFAVLWRRRFRDRARLFLQMMIGMVGLVLAWLMFPFPWSPPTPIP